MSTSITSINDLTDLSLAHIFAFLPPDERIRLERVCRKWQKIAKKHAWTEFRKLKMDERELELRYNKGYDKALAKYQALMNRCGPHLRELSIPAPREYDVEMQLEVRWEMMRNLRHLRVDETTYVGPDALHAVAQHLPRLQSIRFFPIYWQSVAGLHDLLRVNNASLQALHIPMCNSHGGSLHFPALPSSLRLLHISDGIDLPDEQKRVRIDELLELAATCCPQLAMLTLPKHIDLVSELSMTKLAGLERLFYLRLNLNPSNGNLLLSFRSTLAKIGPQLKALLLENVDSNILHLIAKHCPLLEHCYFNFDRNYLDDEEGFLAALQPVFQLAHLRSLSVHYTHITDFFHDQLLNAIDELNVKGTIENLRKLTCSIYDEQIDTELDKLKTLFKNMDRPLELELLEEQLPPELETWKDSKLRIRKDESPERISQAMLRHFWARAMGSVPDLGNLDD